VDQAEDEASTKEPTKKDPWWTPKRPAEEKSKIPPFKGNNTGI
jgi:hypothetical protein